MSDKSPRQGMTKKSGKSIKEKRADKRAKGARGHAVRQAGRPARSDAPRPGGRSAPPPRRTSTGSRSTRSTSPASTRTSARGSRSSTGTASASAYSDTDLAALVAGLASREEILAGSDVVLLPKPQHADVARLREGAVLWGWPHCVQDPVLTQLAIDRRLTLIAFEVMNHWTRDGHVGLHVFHKNNELAGYCSVLQALQLTGRTGDYGRRLSAVVIGFGATARGAVTALNAHGVHDVCVLTSRGVAAVGSPIHSVRILQFDQDPDGAQLSHVITERGRVPVAPFLAERDIVVNCTLQDTAAPLTYLTHDDLDALPSRQPGGGRVLRRGHGLRVGPADRLRRPDVPGGTVDYYAVDHSPSYLWESATWENSLALIPFLRPVLEGASVVGRRRDPEPGDRDPRRPGRQPGHPRLPGPRRGATPTRPPDRSAGQAQASASSSRVSASSCGRVLVRPMIGMKFGVAHPARHDVLVQVGADPRAAGPRPGSCRG